MASERHTSLPTVGGIFSTHTHTFGGLYKKNVQVKFLIIYLFLHNSTVAVGFFPHLHSCCGKFSTPGVYFVRFFMQPKLYFVQGKTGEDPLCILLLNLCNFLWAPPSVVLLYPHCAWIFNLTRPCQWLYWFVSRLFTCKACSCIQTNNFWQHLGWQISSVLVLPHVAQLLCRYFY